MPMNVSGDANASEGEIERRGPDRKAIHGVVALKSFPHRPRAPRSMSQDAIHSALKRLLLAQSKRKQSMYSA